MRQENQYNFTITFDNRKYSLVESWDDFYFDKIEEYFKNSFDGDFHLVLTRETHKIKDNAVTKQSGYAHFHGYIIVYDEYYKFHKYGQLNAYKYFNRVYGNTKIVINQDTDERMKFLKRAGLTKVNSSPYETYHDYCLKEVKDNQKLFKALSIYTRIRKYFNKKDAFDFENNFLDYEL